MKKFLVVLFFVLLSVVIAYPFMLLRDKSQKPVPSDTQVSVNTVLDAKERCLLEMEKALAGDSIRECSSMYRVKERNFFSFLVNADMRMMIARGEEMPYEIDSIDIKNKLKEFLLNPNNDYKLPEYVELELPILGKRNVITRDYYIACRYKNLPIDSLIDSAPYYMEKLFMAINELRNEFALKEFYKSFEKCDSAEQAVCRIAFPCIVGVADKSFQRVVPPYNCNNKKIVEVLEIVEENAEIEESDLVSIEEQGEVIEISENTNIVVEEEVVEETVFQVVEQQPEFPGGMKALMKYLQENISYPRISRDNNSQGRAFIRFVVNADGSIQGVEVLKSSGDIYLDKEAVRVVSSMPKWSPGKQDGKPVNVFFTLPVVF